MKKEEALRNIAKEIERCSVCKQNKVGKAVPGEGSAHAQIVFLGEAPGKTEAATGRPFVGRSGKLLRSLISSIGLNEKDVYITSPVKYLPVKKIPSKKQILHGKTHLDKQLAVIDPKVVVLLGATAAFAIFQKSMGITKNHGTWMEKDNRKYLLTFHPAAALRFPHLRKELKKDFEKLKKELRRLKLL